MTAEQRRELDLENLFLNSGAHQESSGEMCVMEAVAFVAGEEWTDHPKCASTVIGAFLRTWNDDLDDAGRQRLKPYIIKLVGTKASKSVESARAWLAADWMVRVHTPAWLDLGGMTEQAEALRALPEITDTASCRAAQPTLEEAKNRADAAGAAARAAARAAAWAAAWDAAGTAARAAARAAAWDAAGAAAWDAAGAAARAAARAAAWDAAGTAARAAARAAAWDAAGAAAWDAAGAAARAAARAAWGKLAPTKISLQDSAFDLLDRMIALGGSK